MHGLRKPCGLIAVFFIAITFLSSLVACINTPLERYEGTRSLMDTFASVTVYPLNITIAYKVAMDDTISETALEKVEFIS